MRVRDAVGLQVRRLADLPTADVPDGQGSERHVVPEARELSVPEAREFDVPEAHELNAPRRRQLNKYDIPGYARVRSDFPAVADYIAGLEERIRQLMLDGDPNTEQPTHMVSLSRDGLVFAHDAVLQPGQLLSITLTLFPEQHRIRTDCRVEPLDPLREPTAGDHHSCRVSFLRMSDPDRQTLARHVKHLIARLPTLDE